MLFRSGPQEALDIIFAAIAEISAASGLTFIYDGPTTEYVGHRLVGGTEIPDFRESYQPARYGERWAPVWVGARPDFTFTSTVGQAGPVPHLSLRSTQQVVVDGSTFNVGEPTWVSGTVAYHWRKIGGVVSVNDLQAIIRHELGHLIGLNHAGDIDQLMFPSITTVSTFGAGDLLGLHMLGGSTGHPAAPPPSEGTIISNFGLANYSRPSPIDHGLDLTHVGPLGPCTR